MVRQMDRLSLCQQDMQREMADMKVGTREKHNAEKAINWLQEQTVADKNELQVVKYAQLEQLFQTQMHMQPRYMHRLLPHRHAAAHCHTPASAKATSASSTTMQWPTRCAPSKSTSTTALKWKQKLVSEDEVEESDCLHALSWKTWRCWTR